MSDDNLPSVGNNLPAIYQDNNTAGGDIVAGDKIRIEGDYTPVNVDTTFVSISEIKTPLRKMAENYRIEAEQNCIQKQFIEELENYMKRVPGHEQRNLEQKLLAANRPDLVENAKYLKEQFAKKLYKHAFSPLAQNIFVHILSMINCTFQLKVKPLINENKMPSVIDATIYNEIVKIVYQEVGNSELGVNMDYIHGMIYYLTGNCYISWEK